MGETETQLRECLKRRATCTNDEEDSHADVIREKKQRGGGGKDYSSESLLRGGFSLERGRKNRPKGGGKFAFSEKKSLGR